MPPSAGMLLPCVQVPQRQILFRTFGRIFTGLSDTSKAFLIILITGALGLLVRAVNLLVERVRWAECPIASSVFLIILITGGLGSCLR